MTSDTIPTALLACVATIDRLVLTTGSPPPGSDLRSKLDDVLLGMLELRADLDLQPTSTADELLDVPAAVVGYSCGSVWASRFADKMSEISPSAQSFSGWLRRQKSPPSLQAGACELLGKPDLTADHSIEFWSGLWQGIDTGALDHNVKDLVEFWEQFREGALDQWAALREAKYQAALAERR